MTQYLETRLWKRGASREYKFGIGVWEVTYRVFFTLYPAKERGLKYVEAGWMDLHSEFQEYRLLNSDMFISENESKYQNGGFTNYVWTGILNIRYLRL
jgi:hypothetical protein